jgi:hypothetical protein
MSDNDGLRVICCTDPSDCCRRVEGDTSERRKIEIDFLYLDLNVCTWCQGTDSSLEEAIAEVSQILKSTDVDLVVNKVHVTTQDQAEALQFESSPTIRVNGSDIQLDVKESVCESCGDLCGDEVDCRVWVYHGKEYTSPPKAMIIEAILREVYGSSEKQGLNGTAYRLPDNLRKFFRSRRAKIEAEGSR